MYRAQWSVASITSIIQFSTKLSYQFWLIGWDSYQTHYNLEPFFGWRDNICLDNFVNIANIYINLEHWPSHFKTLSSIIIPKPNKASYDSFKNFQPIILLNILGKLIEKVISERLQF